MGRGVAAALAFALALAACSGPPKPMISNAYNPDDPQTWPFEDLVNQAIADAEATTPVCC